MLERLCNKTTFEVEGWRKIIPIVSDIWSKFSDQIDNIDLKMVKIDIRNEEISSNGFAKYYPETKIYKYFKSENPAKVCVYVNAIIEINGEIAEKRLDVSRPNHAVVITGIEERDIRGKKKDCYIIDNSSVDHETRYIPVWLKICILWSPVSFTVNASHIILYESYDMIYKYT